MNVLENFSNNPIYQQFLDHLKKRYSDEYESFTPAEIQDKFETVFIMGLVQSKKFLKTKQSCNILYNGHPARGDMIERLGNILFELQKLPNYPVVPPLRLGDAIKKVIGSDKRYIKKYMDWILTLSNYEAQFNRVDLSWLSNTCPEEMIIGKEW